MASTQVVKTSVTNNSPSQDSSHNDDIFHGKFWRNKLSMFTVMKLVELDQCFDLCGCIKFSALWPPKHKMKVSDSVSGMLPTSRQSG